MTQHFTDTQLQVAELMLSGLSYSLDAQGNAWVWNVVWERWTKLPMAPILNVQPSKS